jgi:hypothetical protein
LQLAIPCNEVAAIRLRHPHVDNKTLSTNPHKTTLQQQ